MSTPFQYIRNEQSDSDVAVRVSNLSKEFIIPHEPVHSVRGAFVNMFKRKSYERFNALDDVSFEVKRGEFFSIVGHNGSGKSTLLKTLAGIYTGDNGTIEINGRISPFLELGIGFNMELSGRDNIYLNATVLGLSQQQIEEKFDEIVAFSEVGRFIDQKVKNYSSGMKVRLAFAVAIHANREVLIMDEVLAVGDANFQKKCLDVFRHFQEMGRTIIFVSHGLGPVKEFSDRVMVMEQGKKIVIAGADRGIFEYNKLLMKQAQAQQKTQVEERVSEEEVALKKQAEEKQTSLGEGNSIVGIHTLDSAGERQEVFEAGDDLVVEIELDVDQIDDLMYVGVGILDRSNDAWICGNHTQFDKFKHDWKTGTNTIRLTFPKNVFHRGDFYIMSSFGYGRPEDQNFYDFYDSREHNVYFRAFPKNKANGAVHLPHEWSHE